MYFVRVTQGSKFSSRSLVALSQCLGSSCALSCPVRYGPSWQYHNEELYANLYSVHSWAGIVVVTLFYLNYLGGFFMFFAKTSSQKVSGRLRMVRTAD